jgi:MYXO-CTERM domain-containing protein
LSAYAASTPATVSENVTTAGGRGLCDGVADGEDAEDAPVWYADADGDGYPDQDVTKAACSAPNGYIADATAWDCDDGDANVHPGATDAGGDGLDQDCDGSDNPAGDGKDGTGCGCATTADPSTGLLALALGLAAVGDRRRR